MIAEIAMSFFGQRVGEGGGGTHRQTIHFLVKKKNLLV